jgi:hypothetical protein
MGLTQFTDTILFMSSVGTFSHAQMQVGGSPLIYGVPSGTSAAFQLPNTASSLSVGFALNLLVDPTLHPVAVGATELVQFVSGNQKTAVETWARLT